MTFIFLQVTFTASQKTAYRLGGAVALDDIELMPGLCPSRKKNAMELCTFDAHDCGYTTNWKSSEKWEHKSRLNSSSPISAVPEEDHTLGTSYGGFWFSFKEKGDMGTQTSFLRTPIYKAPKTSMNCLQFYYIVDDSGSWFNWYRSTKEIYVRAIINYPYSKTKNPTWLITKVQNTTISEWRYAEANVDITEDYQFQFTAFIESSKEVVVAIDDVKLIPGRCPETGFCDFEEDICSWKYGEGQYKWDRIRASSKGIQK
ncbi:MAM and LDL-receptor class A domain-containing protein 2 [Trichonephila clavata]|uniref:MAM and LDL-receptor class A domain-containing protein 2 n=1 Tax=Trichonephila clavata TaxID=2740835 RepID=A0A8X6KLJ6_TRICU|nr:MAM and LDL-receptor class A domain-containing protein 2 [Trichonephila clavata]